MSDVKLIIKISKEDYESIKDDVKKFLSMPSHKVPVLYKAVNEGILLPDNECRRDILPKYKAKVITRGNCMMCGKELTEDLFFCRECEQELEEDIAKTADCEDNS